jgi:septum formation protein
MRLILASASPRRKEILTAAGIKFEVIPSTVEERQFAGEAPEALAQRLAEEKALDVLKRLPVTAGVVVLGADTVVVIDGLALGKPADAADAARMLRMLSGREHRVLTGVCLAQRAYSTGLSDDGKIVQDVAVASTAVRFCGLGEQEISSYVAGREWSGKAGGYAIQGLASRFVEEIHGDYFNVVGLPISLVYRMLKKKRGNPPA